MCINRDCNIETRNSRRKMNTQHPRPVEHMFRACVTWLAIIKKLIFPGPSKRSEENARHAVSRDPISRPMTAALVGRTVCTSGAHYKLFVFFFFFFPLLKNEFSSFVNLILSREGEGRHRRRRGKELTLIKGGREISLRLRKIRRKEFGESDFVC